MTKRRDFIKKSVLGTAGIAIGGMGFSARSYNSVIGANERINFAVIGIGGRGGSHISSLCSLKDSHNVRLITLCDTDEQFFAGRSKTVIDRTGDKPTTEWDMRKVFDNPDIHAVTFATPNHWHALGTIWACQAGKHVYVEKPCDHNIFEGRKMIEASRKYNVRVQVGFQNRSGSNMLEAMKFLHDGGIGEVYMAKGLCYKLRDSFGIAKDSTPPATLHYDMWLGPAPWRQYNEKRGHYNWHWFWDTGNGDTGNQGPHQFDVARWGLNKNEHPVSVYAAGGIYGIDPKECAQETPNTLSCTFKYSDGKILEFETRGRYTNAESSVNVLIGNLFYGTEGYLELYGEPAMPWKAFRKREKEPFAGSKDDASIKQEQPTLTGSGGGNHFTNLIDAIRSGKDSDLNCNITEGHFSCALPHMANISHRLGRGLKFNGATEKFVNDPEADAMLTRLYRKPYVVPDKV
ncbi:MAG: Gfo/Idh/MocA family oxidoreductase [Bacteroidales bacterium]|nr:Gfo/Idh/MocA family oxidoreductase [Bacteroidales bacterium]